MNPMYSHDGSSCSLVPITGVEADVAVGCDVCRGMDVGVAGVTTIGTSVDFGARVAVACEATDSVALTSIVASVRGVAVTPTEVALEQPMTAINKAIPINSVRTLASFIFLSPTP